MPLSAIHGLRTPRVFDSIASGTVVGTALGHPAQRRTLPGIYSKAPLFWRGFFTFCDGLLDYSSGDYLK